ncbi:DUF882 domain-containing protein [Massilia forsythiae]|uniref:Murein endopeptidase K n=1 Tax=Massilia forsythiae TaxID=2728020 RepID=A0A7Z2VUI4_9BURK|nr:DUF882 domain-containing protein [Massilia forsythiae]QJD99521.1 DUF882 domain-containing protein [Massilia forsythiae]
MNQRRSFLKSSAVLASVLGAPAMSRAAARAVPAVAQPAPLPLASDAGVAAGERILRLYNTHTGESLRSVFWAEGRFIPDALQDINKLLRDHRNDKVAPIDPQLLVLLDRVSAQFGDHPTLHIISGYRSPETNEMLHENTSGVAKHSLHMDGKAIDVRIPGRNLASLRKAAMAQRAGGVGYYPDSQFVHMDVGRVRHW